MVPMAMFVQEIFVPGEHTPTARDGIEWAWKGCDGHEGDWVEGKESETHICFKCQRNELKLRGMCYRSEEAWKDDRLA